jgi:hypothetical protein
MASRRWAWISAVAVLFAGITNAHAHVHLCFDGQEPPASVHLSGTSGHHDGVRPADQIDGFGHYAGDADHDDVDLDLANPALAKTVKHDVTALAPAWFNGAPIAPSTSEIVPFALDRPIASARTYLHPPLRAPPP